MESYFFIFNTKFDHLTVYLYDIIKIQNTIKRKVDRNVYK